EPLAWAVRSGRFGAVQASVNVCDQRILGEARPEAAARGLGIIAKRPLANAPWRFSERPREPDVALYWERFLAMGVAPGELAWDEIALRFAAFQPGVACVIAGTASLERLRRNARLLERGPLPEALDREIRGAFRRNDRGWLGLI